MKTLWLGRSSDDYHLGLYKKYWGSVYGLYCFSAYQYEVFCKDRWEFLTGIKLQPGEIVKVKITPIKDGFKLEVVK